VAAFDILGSGAKSEPLVATTTFLARFDIPEGISRRDEAVAGPCHKDRYRKTAQQRMPEERCGGPRKQL